MSRAMMPTMAPDCHEAAEPGAADLFGPRLRVSVFPVLPVVD